MYSITTTPSPTPSTIRSTALGAVLALLLVGATACGTANGDPSTRTPLGQTATQHLSTDQPFAIDLIEWAKVHQPTYRYQVRAERWNAGQHTPRTHRPPGSNKALLGER
jgi:hypothetical protein